MDEDLRLYLESSIVLSVGHVFWENGTLPMKITTYLSNDPAPENYISSSRSVVFKDNTVLVISQENGHQYILPGGRLEAGEDALDALHREVLEETGWTIDDIRYLGFMHLLHLGEKPPGYAYSFPDIIWPVYISEAVEYIPEKKIFDEWVSGSEFRDIIEVQKLPLDTGELLLLKHALELRNSKS